MRIRIVLAIILLAVGLCFVPILGYGQDKLDRPKGTKELVETIEDKGLPISTWAQIANLESKLNYIMWNPHDYLCIYLEWDYMGLFHLERELPEDIIGKTEGKLIIQAYDNRGVFAGISEVGLLDQFKKELKRIYYYVPQGMFSKMDRDVVALFYGYKGEPLGYFCQGEYHLWKGERESK